MPGKRKNARAGEKIIVVYVLTKLSGYSSHDNRFLLWVTGGGLGEAVAGYDFLIKVSA